TEVRGIAAAVEREKRDSIRVIERGDVFIVRLLFVTRHDRGDTLNGSLRHGRARKERRRELRTAPRVRVLELLIIGGVVFPPLVGFTDDALDVMKERGD